MFVITQSIFNNQACSPQVSKYNLYLLHHADMLSSFKTFSNCFILVIDVMDPEPNPATLSMRLEYTMDGTPVIYLFARIHSHCCYQHVCEKWEENSDPIGNPHRILG